MPIESERIPLGARQPTVSAHRRMQNRISQRRFRERKAQAKASEEKVVDITMIPHAEADTASPFPCSHDSRPAFNYSLDENFAANGDDLLDLLTPNFSDTSIDLETPLCPSDWHTATSMNIDIRPTPPYMNAYASSVVQPVSHEGISSLSGPVEAHYTAPSPSNTCSQREPLAYLSPPPSEANSSFRAPTEAMASASSIPSRPQSIERSLSHDASITSTHTNRDAKSPPPLLHVATRSRSRAVMQVLLRRGVAAINERDGEGRTALHIAGELGEEVLVRLLLEQGADPRIKDARGRLALHDAIEKGHCEVVEVLLDHRM